MDITLDSSDYLDVNTLFFDVSGSYVAGTVLSGDTNEQLAGISQVSGVVNNGGQIMVENGGSTVGATLTGGATAASEEVVSGGSATGTIVNFGGELFLESGATASGTIVNSGGMEFVESGGSVNGSIVNNNSTEAIFAGATATNMVVNSGGLLSIETGALVDSTLLKAGSIVQIIGVTADTAKINASNALILTSGGVVVYTLTLAPGSAGLSYTAEPDLFNSSSSTPFTDVFVSSSSSSTFNGITSESNDAWLNHSFTLTGTSNDPSDPITIYETYNAPSGGPGFVGQKNILGTATVKSDGTWTFTVSRPTYGTGNYTYTVSQATAAGSTTQVGGGFTINWDAETPQLTNIAAEYNLDAPSQPVTETTQDIRFYGAATMDNISTVLGDEITVDVYYRPASSSLGYAAGSVPNDAVLLGVATLNGSGGWNYDLHVATLVQEGRITLGETYTFFISAVDLANNTSSLSFNQTFAPLPETVAQVLSASTTNMSEIFSVSDSAASVSANLTGLQNLAAAGKLGAIALTDNGVPVLSITTAQASADAATLAAITGSFSVAQTATGSNLTIAGIVNAVGNTVVFSGAASQYTVTSAGDGVHFTVATTGSQDQLSDIQALQFNNLTEIVAQTPGGPGSVTGGNITELYGAILGRVPDAAGLAFYQNFLAAHPATPLQQFAEWFLASAEYTSTPAHAYAESSAGDAQFITDSYQNLLHRVPSTSELSFYQTKVMAPAEAGLTPGSAAFAAAQNQAHALMLVYFSASPEFLSDVQVTAVNPASAGFTGHWLVLI